MPCGASGDLDHIEFASANISNPLADISILHQQKYRQNPDAVFCIGIFYVGPVALPTPTRSDDRPGEEKDQGAITAVIARSEAAWQSPGTMLRSEQISRGLPRPDGLAVTWDSGRVAPSLDPQFRKLVGGGSAARPTGHYEQDKKERACCEARPFVFGTSSGQGKKQEGVKKEVRGEGRRKNLDRRKTSIPVHPVESRGRQEQAERVGIKFVSAADRLEEDFRRPEKTFFVSGLLFLSDGDII